MKCVSPFAKRLAALILATLAGGCTTIERDQVALSLCGRTSWCTATEGQPPQNGPPQVQAMEGRKPDRVVGSPK